MAKRNLRSLIRNIIKFGENDYTFFKSLNRGNILDLGAGSGILSIAALKFGASYVKSIEYDLDSSIDILDFS